jgi:hypothetical protein
MQEELNVVAKQTLESQPDQQEALGCRNRL